MEPILTIDNLNSFGGNMLRQGDKSQLKYRLRDVGNKNLGISGKSCEIKMYGRNYTTVVYETTTTVTTENTVSFTIDKVLPKGTFYLEFTVGDYIFPTDHREFFEITPSGKGVDANIIEIVGKDVLIQEVKSQVDTELQPLVTSLESAEQAEAQRVQAENERSIKFEEIERGSTHFEPINSILNGNFNGGIDNWTAYGSLEYALLENGVNLSSNGKVRAGLIQGENFIGSHKYYLSLESKHNSGEPYIYTTDSDLGRYPIDMIDQFTTAETEVSRKEYVFTASKNATYFLIGRGGTVAFDIDVYNIILIDLTEMFGVGNEDNLELLLTYFPTDTFFDGSLKMNRIQKFLLGITFDNLLSTFTNDGENWEV